jgi:apolipoprotein N-acyltransferase
VLNVLLALFTAALLISTFPGIDIVLFATVALAPLLVAVAREPRNGRRFLLGWGAGIVYWFGVCYWIQFVLEVHGGMGAFGSWGAFLLFCLAKAIHLGVFSLAAGPLMRRWYAVPAVSALWVAIEATHGPLGFAWQALGNAGIDMSVPMRLAPITGVYGLSFVFVLMNTALALVALRRKRRELLWLAPMPLLYLLPALPDAQPGAERAVLVQANVSESADWTRNSLSEAQERLAYTSLQAALNAGRPAPKLLVWPEVPAPFYFYGDAQFRDQTIDLARLTRTWFLFGTVAHTPSGAPLNSAVFLGPNGQYAGRYDKIYLVPFGEFVPPFFDFVNRITSEAGDFAPGKELVVFHADGHRIASFICYEAVFPHLVRRFAAAGAEVLVNISNDGYFGRSAARDQHLKIVRMRAAENRRWILRATNNGVTAVIDPAGRILDRLPSYEQATMVASYSYIAERTPYTRFGDWLAWLCAAIALLTLLCSLRPLRSRR